MRAEQVDGRCWQLFWGPPWPQSTPTVAGIALRAIGRDFGASMTTLQWVVTAYALALAGPLLFAGTLGDRYGRKRIFLSGVAWFTLASLICGLSPNAPTLIAARAV